jgi:hypothetical protein
MGWWQKCLSCSLCIPLFVLDERLGRYQLIPESWLYPATFGIVTVVLLIIAAQWKQACVVVTSLFVINIMFALYFLAVYNPKA